MRKFLILILAAIPLLAAGCGSGNWYRVPSRGFIYIDKEPYRLDPNFINEIWARIKEDLRLDPKIGLPDIKIRDAAGCCDYTGNSATLGRYYHETDTIEICFLSFFINCLDLDEETRKVYMYNTVAHELIHCGLSYYKWDFFGEERLPDHCVMENYLDRITDYIDAHFKNKGKAKELSMLNLKTAYEKEKCDEIKSR